MGFLPPPCANMKLFFTRLVKNRWFTVSVIAFFPVNFTIRLTGQHSSCSPSFQAMCSHRWHRVWIVAWFTEWFPVAASVNVSENWLKIYLQLQIEIYQRYQSPGRLCVPQIEEKDLPRFGRRWSICAFQFLLEYTIPCRSDIWCPRNVGALILSGISDCISDIFSVCCTFSVACEFRNTAAIESWCCSPCSWLCCGRLNGVEFQHNSPNTWGSVWGSGVQYYWIPVHCILHRIPLAVWASPIFRREGSVQ